MKEKKRVELLAPGGDIHAIKAAITAGANAIYCGLDRFNARNRAANITLDSLKSLLRIAHRNECKIFLTLNIIILQSEFSSLCTLLNKLVNTTIDGVIVQDIGLFYLLKEKFPRLAVHASTQCTTHNRSQLLFLKKLGAERVNLCRELSLKEIAPLTEEAHNIGIEVEVFVHGSNCISVSGLCYMSSHQSGNSGNRGRCSQPCRDAYEKTEKGVTYPLNLKDKSAWDELPQLLEMGVDSLKIEGRIKKYHYVHRVVESWRNHINSVEKMTPTADKEQLFSVFNRDLSNDYLRGELRSSHFIDNPRDHSALHRVSEHSAPEALKKAKQEIYEERTELIKTVNTAIADLDLIPPTLELTLSGREGEPLILEIVGKNDRWRLTSQSPLRKSTQKSSVLHSGLILSRFKQLSELGYTISTCQTKNLEPNLTIPFRDLTTLKKEALYLLNEKRDFLPPVELPTVPKNTAKEKTPTMALLISDLGQVNKIPEEVTVYLALPNIFPDDDSELLSHFNGKRTIYPWFPSLLIGDEFTKATAFLKKLLPNRLITDNSGIAYEAAMLDIPWIAGPQMNSVNSLTLKALQKEFNCKGAFISNEINKNQVRQITAPDNFELHYSLYHPSILMTGRQCFFHQTAGCQKKIIDQHCLTECSRKTTIKDLKGREYILEKSPGNYHHLFAKRHYLNTAIITDYKTKFDSFLLDLRNISTETPRIASPVHIVTMVQRLLSGDQKAEETLHTLLTPTEFQQYKKGL